MTKEELVQKAKELSELEDQVSAYTQALDLRRRWRNTNEDEESLYDKELADSFFGYLDKIKEASGEITLSVEERKKEIIEKAKELLDTDNFRKASTSMNDLLNQWKRAGRVNQEVDDELWAKFKEVRDEFFEKRKEYFDSLEETFAKNKEAKESIIQQAIQANTSENFKEIGQKMDELMEQWKAVGHAGKQHEEELWQQFNAERKAFYKNRRNYYNGLKETFAQRAEDKRELIAQAKQTLANSIFTDEEYQSMKDLRNKWKEIGHAGREHEEELWKEFNETMTIYFDNSKYYRDNNNNEE